MKSRAPKAPRHIDYAALRQHVADFPDSTLAERAEHFGVSPHGIFYALSKLNITRKKNTNLQRTVSGKTPRVLTALQRETEKHGKAPVYLDETGFTETDFRRYAYAPKGVRVEAKVPGHRYRTTTLIAARLAGVSRHPCFRGEL